MNWAAILYFGLLCVGFASGVAKHGRPRTPYSAGDDLIAFSLACVLLYFAGFFG